MTDEDLDFERGRSKWSKFNNEGRGGVARGGFPNSFSEYKEYKRTRDYEQGGIGGNQKRSNGSNRDIYEPPVKKPRYWDHDERLLRRDNVQEIERGIDSKTEESIYQPNMLTFKAFLSNQDDSITEEEAMIKYGQYKAEFRRQQLYEFFVAHKSDEWFMERFHPSRMVDVRMTHMDGRTKRAEVFWEMYSRVSQVRIDAEMQEDLVTLMDLIVIKLEGGSEDHIKAYLEKSEEESLETSVILSNSNSNFQKYSKERMVADQIKYVAGNSSTCQADGGDIPEEGHEGTNGSSEDSNVSKSSGSGGDVEDDLELSGNGHNSDELDEKELVDQYGKVAEEDSVSTDSKDKVVANECGLETKCDGGSGAVEEQQFLAKGTVKMNELPQVDGAQDDVDLKDDLVVDPTMVEPPLTTPEPNELSKPTRRNLHSTVSIHLRNVPGTITRAELKSVCSKYDGFLRLALSDPTPEKKWFRRGWITFAKGSNVKETCCSLGDIRLGGVDLGPVINRELSKRVRLVTGLVNDRKVVRSNIKLASKIIQNMDKNWGLSGMFGGDKLTENIADFLVEEASAEEDELLGVNIEDGEVSGGMIKINREEDLIGVLDMMILYLRVVHSVDFYNHSEYPYEDQMPNRLGLLHVRGPVPKDAVSQQEIDDYVESFEKKISGFLAVKKDLTEEEILTLGGKREEEEVEKFIMLNSQELAKDKWLCPLSGKKFKGPEFIRKHIMSKFVSRIEQVKADVQYFNNYLRDPKRPQLLEKHKVSRASSRNRGERKYEDQRSFGRIREATRFPVYERRDNWNRPAFHYRGGGGHNKGWGRHMRERGGYHGREDPRGIVDYSDFETMEW